MFCDIWLTHVCYIVYKLLLFKEMVVVVMLIFVLWVSLQVNQTLSDAGQVPRALFVSATDLQVYDTILVIVAELDVTTDTSVFAALLHNVERRSVYRQASWHQHSVERRAAAVGIVNSTTGYVANSKHAYTLVPCIYAHLTAW